MINTKVDYLLINLLNEVNQYIKKIFGGTVNIIQSIFTKFEETEKNYKNEINQKDIKIEELSKQIQIKKKKINNNKVNENKKEKILIKDINDNNNIDNKENEYLENRTEYNNDKSNRDKNSNKDFNIINNNDNSNFSISYNDEAKNIIDNLKQGNSNRIKRKKKITK